MPSVLCKNEYVTVEVSIETFWNNLHTRALYVITIVYLEDEGVTCPHAEIIHTEQLSIKQYLEYEDVQSYVLTITENNNKHVIRRISRDSMEKIINLLLVTFAWAITVHLNKLSAVLTSPHHELWHTAMHTHHSLTLCHHMCLIGLGCH